MFYNVGKGNYSMNIKLFERMLEISRQMAETRDIDQLLQLAMNEALEIIDAESGYLVLLGPDDELQFRVRFDHPKAPPGENAEELSHTIFNDVIQSGKSRLITDALSDQRYSDRPLRFEYLQRRTLLQRRRNLRNKHGKLPARLTPGL